MTPIARPDWFDEDSFPVDSHGIQVDGATVHYVDEGSGPVLLMLHGNPTWSFLYRKLILELRFDFRCVAVDYPGFGLSRPPSGYAFTPAEHSRIVGGLVSALDLDEVVLVAQDWGGPIGMGAVLADADRYIGFVLGNTWAWPLDGDTTARRFSSLMGEGFSGYLLSRRLNLFVRQIIPRSMRRRSLSRADRAMYNGPFPTHESRIPVQVFPRELIGSTDFLRDVEAGLGSLADRPLFLPWADRDPAFGEEARLRWQSLFPGNDLHILRGSGHYWQDDAGEEAAAAIRAWYQRTFGYPA